MSASASQFASDKPIEPITPMDYSITEYFIHNGPADALEELRKTIESKANTCKYSYLTKLMELQDKIIETPLLPSSKKSRLGDTPLVAFPTNSREREELLRCVRNDITKLEEIEKSRDQSKETKETNKEKSTLLQLEHLLNSSNEVIAKKYRRRNEAAKKLAVLEHMEHKPLSAEDFTNTPFAVADDKTLIPALEGKKDAERLLTRYFVHSNVRITHDKLAEKYFETHPIEHEAYLSKVRNDVKASAAEFAQYIKDSAVKDVNDKAILSVMLEAYPEGVALEVGTEKKRERVGVNIQKIEYYRIYIYLKYFEDLVSKLGPELDKHLDSSKTKPDADANAESKYLEAIKQLYNQYRLSGKILTDDKNLKSMNIIATHYLQLGWACNRNEPSQPDSTRQFTGDYDKDLNIFVHITEPVRIYADVLARRGNGRAEAEQHISYLIAARRAMGISARANQAIESKNDNPASQAVSLSGPQGINRVDVSSAADRKNSSNNTNTGNARVSSSTVINVVNAANTTSVDFDPAGFDKKRRKKQPPNSSDTNFPQARSM